MSYTILDFKTDLEGKIHGTTLNKISNPIGLAYEAMRNCLSILDFHESRRKVVITNPIFDSVYSYVLPSDLKGDKIISILPAVDSYPSSKTYHVNSENFDTNKYLENNIYDVEYNTGVKTLKLSTSNLPGKTLHNAESLTENGTWAVSGDAFNIRINGNNKFSGSKSICFDLNVSGTEGRISNSNFTAIDLSEEKDEGSVFVPVYLPNREITSFKLEWGDDTSNHWHNTVTTQSDGTAFEIGWNLLRFDWSSATQQGSPNASSVNFLRLNISYTGTAMTGVCIDNIVVRLGSVYEIKYYSKFGFRTQAGIWIEKPTLDTDIVNLDTDSYNIFLYEAAFLSAQSIQGEDAVFDRNFFEGHRDKLIIEYRKNYRSEVKKPQSNYNQRLYRNLR